jgi:DNA ligase (NAD+)
MGELSNCKQLPFERIIFAMGIKFVGEKTAMLVAQSLLKWQDLFSMTLEDFEAINGVGAKTATVLVETLPQLKSRFDRLSMWGFMMEIVRHDQGPRPLQGQCFVVTGTLPHYSRSAIEALITQHGGEVRSAVSKTTHYVVVGDSPGSKKEKAVSLGIPTLDEASLMALLSEVSP